MGAFPLISIFSLQLRLNQLFFLKIIFKMKLAVSLFVASFLALVTTTQTENSDSDGDPVFDPCSAPMDAGPCKESKASYYFDKSSMSCKIRMYGGCGGNGNNFRKKSDCLGAYKAQIVEAVKKVEEAVEEEVEEAVKEEAVQEEADEEMAEEMAEEEMVKDKPAK